MPFVGHEFEVRRARKGMKRMWRAYCACGWRSFARSIKVNADALGNDHVVKAAGDAVPDH